jgi:hypothetical protein
LSSVEELAKAKQYLRDLTCGGLLLTESRTVAETLLQPLPEADWKRLFTDENILKKNSPHTAIRYAKAIRQRLQPLGIEFNHAVVNASDSDYKQLLMLAFIIHKPVMVAFMQSVVAETKRVYKPNLAADAWDSFIHERARTLPGLNKLSSSTVQKSGSNIIRSLVEAGYLNNNRQRLLQPVYLLPTPHVWLDTLHRKDLVSIMECTL